MLSKPFFRTLAAAIALAACAVAASAQVTQVTGKVTLKQADGTEVPVQGAVIDIYRTDIAQKFQVKTDKKGAYIHAGLPFVGTYTLVVSAPGARPTYASGLRFTQVQTKDFVLEPGDGSKLTLEQVKQFDAAGGGGGAPAAGGGGGSESKEAKAAREERERKVKEIEAKNAEITKSNEVVGRTFKAGNEALTAGRVDEAITNYREGLAARPDEPALLTNLAEALRRRADDRYNAAIQIKDVNDPGRTQGIEAAKKDWTEAAATAQKAIDAATAAPGTDPQQQEIYAKNKLFALRGRAMSMRRVATKVDTAQAPQALAAYEAYLAAETDPAAKSKYRGEVLQMLFDAGATDLAIDQARKVLAENPDDVDANRIIGLALFATGDKAKFQEAANYLQHYVDKAPDTDPLKQSAKESLDYLKTAENVKPEKTQPSRTTRRRP